MSRKRKLPTRLARLKAAIRELAEANRLLDIYEGYMFSIGAAVHLEFMVYTGNKSGRRENQTVNGVWLMRDALINTRTLLTREYNRNRKLRRQIADLLGIDE